MASIGNITFACDDPTVMAEFWASALEYEVQVAPPEFMEEWIAAGHDPNGAAAIIDPKGKSPRFFFLKKAKRPEVAGTSTPIHLDLSTTDRMAEVERLIALGAQLVEHVSHKIGDMVEEWTEMKDPEGNGFCVQG
jgi:catechol 2,3-dioxygenase-like lactoylglutathione lyase family enzyme